MLLQGSPRSRPIQRGKLRTVKGLGPLAKVSLPAARETSNGALHRFVQTGETKAVSPQPGGRAQGLPSAEMAKLQLRPDPQRPRIGSDQGAIKIKEGNRHAGSVTRIAYAAREVSVEPKLLHSNGLPPEVKNTERRQRQDHRAGLRGAPGLPEHVVLAFLARKYIH